MPFLRKILSLYVIIAIYASNLYAHAVSILPFQNNTTNTDIILRGEPQPGETPVYAHMAETDSTTKVVGKLNLLTFENKIQVCLVPINDVQNDEETNRRCIVV